MLRVLLLPLAGLLLSTAAHADYRYQGEARDPDSGKVLYEEDHLLRVNGDVPSERLVLYRCADGALFARKRVEYATALSAPAFVLDDERFGYREGVTRDAGGLTTFFRPDAGSKQLSAAVSAGKLLVIDAGFDEFVRANWAALQAGQTLPVDFLVPSRLGTLRFKLKRIGGAEIAGAPASTFRLSLGGFIGLFAPDIEVSYRDSDRRLMRFEGLTNIRAARDENLVARIDFPPARQQTGVSDADWTAAENETLTRCTPGG